MILHLGVIDLPYVSRETPSQMHRRLNRKKQPHPPAGAKTTGDVAEILEEKYHVMEIFYELHQDKIIGVLEESIGGAIESLISGAPVTISPFGEGESTVKDLFSKFLTEKEMDKLGYPGVPTKASLQGVSHRFKNKRGSPGRPSFVDTGLYEASFKAWVD